MSEQETPMIVLVRDLMFASKIRATAQSLGATVTMLRDPAKLAGETGARLIVDLNQEGAIEAAAAWKAAGAGREIVGFVSHVDAATITRAREAGVDKVLARSQFVQQVEQLLSP